MRSLSIVEYLSLDEVIQAAGMPAGFSGDHQGFATHPGPFADTVHKALHGS